MPLISKLYMDCNVKRNLMEKTAYKSDLKVIILGVGPLGFPLIRRLSPGTPASSNTKTGCHDIAEILLKYC
jgi:hypothetical protein